MNLISGLKCLCRTTASSLKVGKRTKAWERRTSSMENHSCISNTRSPECGSHIRHSRRRNVASAESKRRRCVLCGNIIIGIVDTTDVVFDMTTLICDSETVNCSLCASESSDYMALYKLFYLLTCGDRRQFGANIFRCSID